MARLTRPAHHIALFLLCLHLFLSACQTEGEGDGHGLKVRPGPRQAEAQDTPRPPPSQSQASPRLPYDVDNLPAQERLPIPDPTRLTSQALREAITALKDVIYTRLEGMDKALQLLQARSDRFPAELDAKIGTVRDLLSERFKGIELQFEGIQLQFKERDTRVEQTARDSKTAVDAALQAAKRSGREAKRGF